MDCTQVREELSALLDGELSPELRREVEAHLSECSDCLREADALKRVDSAYRAMAGVSAPDGFEEKVRAGLQKKVVAFPERRVRPIRLWPLVACAAMAIAFVAVVASRMLPGPARMELAKSSPPVAAPVALYAERAGSGAGAADSVADKAPGTLGANMKRDEEAKLEAGKPLTAPVSPPPVASPAPSPIKAPAPEPEAKAKAMVSKPKEAFAPTLGVASDVKGLKEAVGKEGEVRTVSSRQFTLTEGVWREGGYANEACTRLARDSEALSAFLKEHPEVTECSDLRPAVLFKMGNAWYRVE